MVWMGVCPDIPVQLCDTLFLEIWEDFICGALFAGINQHSGAVCENQFAVSLSHIQEMYCTAAFSRSGRGISAKGLLCGIREISFNIIQRTAGQKKQRKRRQGRRDFFREDVW